jgi:hypothetical protein
MPIRLDDHDMSRHRAKFILDIENLLVEAAAYISSLVNV